MKFEGPTLKHVKMNEDIGLLWFNSQISTLYHKGRCMTFSSKGSARENEASSEFKVEVFMSFLKGISLENNVEAVGGEHQAIFAEEGGFGFKVLQTFFMEIRFQPTSIFIWMSHCPGYGLSAKERDTLQMKF